MSVVFFLKKTNDEYSILTILDSGFLTIRL